MKTNLSVNFTKHNTNKKDETILEFQVRGELTDEQVIALARLKAAGTVTIAIGSSQMDFDDMRPEAPREGLRGTIAKDGIATLDDSEDDRQMTLEEAAARTNDPADAEESNSDQEADESGAEEEETDQPVERCSEDDDVDSANDDLGDLEG